MSINYVTPATCQRRCPVVIGSAVAESNTYALLLNGSGGGVGTRLPDELFTLCQADGGDICFTADLAGRIRLPMQLVAINKSAKTAIIWVAAPLTASATTTIYAWYQSSAGTLAQPAASAPFGSQAVWTAVGNMAGVWHLGETGSGAVGDYQDSSASGNNSTNTATQPTATTGPFGGAQDFSSAIIDFNGTAGSNLPASGSNRTISCWFKTTQALGSGGFVNFAYYGTSASGEEIGFGLYNPFGAGTGPALTQNGDSVYVGGFCDGAWHWGQVAYDGVTWHLYVDGVHEADNNMAGHGGTFTVLSSVLSFGDGYVGSLAEMRIASVVNSANYVATDYAIQTSTSLVAAGTPTAAATGTTSALFQRKCPLTINGSLIGETGTYAVLFDGSGDTFGTRLPDELFTRCQSDGGDIVFTSDSSGTNILPMELVWINTSAKTCEIWVAVPLTAATNTTIYAWYQSSVGTQSQPAVNAPCGSQAVWEAVGNMCAVYHFGTASTWSGADSTVNGNTLAGGTAASGEFGGSTASPTTLLNGYGNNLPGNYDGSGGALTYQTRFKITNLANVQGSIGGWGNNTAGERWNHWYQAGQLGVEMCGFGPTMTWASPDTNWHSLVTANPAGNTNTADVLFYLDGTPQTNTGGAPRTFNVVNANLAVGTLPGDPGQYNLTGDVDELRISSVQRSASYLATDNAAQVNTSFVSVGTPVSGGPSIHNLAVVDQITVTNVAMDKAIYAYAVDHVNMAQTAAGRNSTLHLSVVSQVKFSENLPVRDAVQRLRVADPVSVLDTATAYDTTQHLAAIDTLSILDATNQHNSTTFAVAADRINFVDTAVTTRGGPIDCVASDSLALIEAVSVLQPIYLSVTDVLDTLIYTALDPVTYETTDIFTGLQDLATFAIGHARQSVTERLAIRDMTGYGIIHAGGIVLSVTDTITIVDVANKTVVPPTEVDTLTLGDLAVAEASKPVNDALSVVDRATVNVVRNLSVVDRVLIEESFLYVLPYEIARLEYMPFVGKGVSGSPTPPPATLAVPPLLPGEFTLFYPPYPDVAIDTIVLRKPEFGNKDRLQFNRVSRETRGGTLIVYADPMWPKTQTLVLTFSALTPNQAFGLIYFLERHLGLPIGLMDWEGRQWSGVVVNPNDPVVQDSKYSFTGSLEFEGQLVTDMLATAPGTGYGGGVGYTTPGAG